MSETSEAEPVQDTTQDTVEDTVQQPADDQPTEQTAADETDPEHSEETFAALFEDVPLEEDPLPVEPVPDEQLEAEQLAPSYDEPQIEGALKSVSEALEGAIHPENGDLGAKLDEILGSIAILQDETPGPQLKAPVDQIEANLELAESRHDVVDGWLQRLSDDVKELRSQLSATHKTTLNSAKTVENISETLATAQVAATTTPTPVPSPATRGEPAWNAKMMVLGVSVLLMSWSLMFYLKAGSTTIALVGLGLVNLAGCAAILLGRREG